MFKRILAIWFGFICCYCGIDIILHGFYSWKFRNPLGSKVIAILILIFGIYLVVYAVTPKIAKIISDKFFRRKTV